MEKIEADYQASLAKYDYVTMEGSGGIICPIRWDEEHILLEDIIKKLDLGVLVISNAALGSINNCVLTISYLKQKTFPSAASSLTTMTAVTSCKPTTSV